MRAYFSLIVLLFVLIVSCQETDIYLPENPVMEHYSIAVVLSEYAVCYKQPSKDADIVFFLRVGDIVQVENITLSDTEKWFEINSDSRIGWVKESEFRFVQTMEQAHRLVAILQPKTP